ncbi:MAG: hypothetical protein RLZZ227_2192 [Pseudomonadota bacterium]|jgi:esterase/lipase
MHPFLRKPYVLPGLRGLLVVCLVLALLYAVLARGKALDVRHRPLDFAESFDFGGATLIAYDDYAQRRLRAAHPELADVVIANLAPFRLEPPADCPRSASGGYRSGVVLTHDLQDSPYTMRALGEYFQRTCFVVYGLLLPGHGTRAGDLLRSGWQDWFAAQRFATRELGREVETLYLAGHGVGATLAMLEAATNADVDGLVLFAPRLDLQAPPWQAVAGSALGWLFAPARWAEAVPATTPYRDASRPWSMFAQINGLVASTQAALPSTAAEIPVFSVLSLDDTTVDPQAVLAYMAARTHPQSHTYVYSRQQVSAAAAMTLRLTAFPEYRRLSLSHLGLMLPGSDTTFGRDRTSRECGHYFSISPANYATCMAGESDFLGETTPGILAEGVVERIAYNPHFSELVGVLDSFLAPVGRVIPRVPR